MKAAKSTLYPRRKSYLKGAAIYLHIVTAGSVTRVSVTVHRKLRSAKDCVSGGTLSVPGSAYQQQSDGVSVRSAAA